MADTQQHLNAQQIQAYEKRLSEQLSAAVAAMNLRKWAVEQALSHHASPDTAMAVANQIYDFIVQPANVKIEVG